MADDTINQRLTSIENQLDGIETELVKLTELVGSRERRDEILNLTELVGSRARRDEIHQLTGEVHDVGMRLLAAMVVVAGLLFGALHYWPPHV